MTIWCTVCMTRFLNRGDMDVWFDMDRIHNWRSIVDMFFFVIVLKIYSLVLLVVRGVNYLEEFGEGIA